MQALAGLSGGSWGATLGPFGVPCARCASLFQKSVLRGWGAGQGASTGVRVARPQPGEHSGAPMSYSLGPVSAAVS